MAPLSSPDSRYFHNAAGSISHVAGEDYLRLHWTTVQASPDELRAVYQHALRAMRHFGYQKLLSDHANRPPMPPAVVSWLAEEWVPLAVREAGYSHCAIVENVAPLGRLAAHSVGSQLPRQLIAVGYFPTLAEAVAWLRAQ